MLLIIVISELFISIIHKTIDEMKVKTADVVFINPVFFPVSAKCCKYVKKIKVCKYVYCMKISKN